MAPGQRAVRRVRWTFAQRVAPQDERGSGRFSFVVPQAAAGKLTLDLPSAAAGGVLVTVEIGVSAAGRIVGHLEGGRRRGPVSTADVEANLRTTERLVRDAADAGARTVLLPEAFAILGPAPARLAVAESLDAGGPILDRCRRLAQACAVDLVLGGFPEACDAEPTS